MFVRDESSVELKPMIDYRRKSGGTGKTSRSDIRIQPTGGRLAHRVIQETRARRTPGMPPTRPGLFMTEKGQAMKAPSTYTVLVVDDNAIQAAIRQAILRRAGYFVVAALNPTRALELFSENGFPTQINAVITDHIMPGMNGSAFVRELRKTRPHLPVFVISGLDEAEPEYTGLDVRFLLKPLPPDLLLSNLRDLLEPQEQGAA
jgi:CheY-like chemotaxis protein